MPYGRKTVGGNLILATIPTGSLGFSSIVSRRHHKKARKKNKSRRKHSHRKSKSISSHSSKSRRKHSRATHSRRRGMSASFLRALRKKHHLGEFKK